MRVSNGFDADFDDGPIVLASDSNEPHTVRLRMDQFFSHALIEVPWPVGQPVPVKLPDFVRGGWSPVGGRDLSRYSMVEIHLSYDLRACRILAHRARIDGKFREAGIQYVLGHRIKRAGTFLARGTSLSAK